MQLQKHLKILMEELKLLAGLEMNSHRKDELINQLNSEISVLQRRLLQNESGSTDLSEVRQKLTHLEKEMVREKMETKSLKCQVSHLMSLSMMYNVHVLKFIKKHNIVQPLLVPFHNGIAFQSLRTNLTLAFLNAKPSQPLRQLR